MQVREVVTAMGEMKPLDFPKSAVLNTHVSCGFLGAATSVIETFPTRAHLLELVP